MPMMGRACNGGNVRSSFIGLHQVSLPPDDKAPPSWEVNIRCRVHEVLADE